MNRAAIFAASLVAMLQSPPAKAGSWQWRDGLSAGSVLTLDLVRAQVRAVSIGTGPAAIDVAYEDTAPVAFRTTKQGNGVVVAAGSPAAPGMQLECLPPIGDRAPFASSHAALWVVVQVPPHVRLVVRLMGGGIDARDLRGEGHDLVANHGSMQHSR